MRLKAPLFLFAAVFAAVLVVGCGGSDESGDGSAGEKAGETASSDSGGEGVGNPAPPLSASSLSKAQYRKRANAVCARGQEERSQASVTYVQENSGQSEGERAEGLLEVYAPMWEEEIAQLRELGAPRGDVPQVEAIIEAIEKWVNSIEQLEDLTAGSDVVDRQINRAGKLARRYGLTDCASG